MANAKQIKEDAMAKVNSILTALDLYPNDTQLNTFQSINISLNPIDLIMDFFKSTKGYDWLINIIAGFVAFSLPALELSVKGVLLSHIQTMLSCSIKPFITEEMIRDGVVFDLNKIDLFNMFRYSPLDKSNNNPGKYYYFGCDKEDGIEILDDVKYSRDFNAVLWYAKNTSGERIVWRREMDLDKPFNLAKKSVGGGMFSWMKQVKSNGIVTIEFNDRSSGLTDAEHNGGLFTTEPMSNCVHLFIGCCAPDSASDYSEEISQCTQKVSMFNDLIKTLDDKTEAVNTQTKSLRTEAIQRGATTEELNRISTNEISDLEIIKDIRDAIYGDEPIIEVLGKLTFDLNVIHEQITIPQELSDTNITEQKRNKIHYMVLEEEGGSNLDYPSAKSNYYYRHPLFEWNTDLVQSMKLFDEKVVTSQLLDALTNCLKFSGGLNANGNVNIDIQSMFVQSQLRDLITKVIETDGGTVSDCFFSFTNDSYNALLNETELAKAGLLVNNETTVSNVPSVEDVMNGLNTLSAGASKEEIQSTVAGSIFSAASSTTPFIAGYDTYNVDVAANLGFNANMNIIDQLLTKLTYVIVSTIIQPKIYLILMANLKFMGNEPNFDLAKFMQQFKNMIIDLIREIRDQILEYFRQKMVEILQELVKSLAIKLTLEQYKYYINLIMHCIDCLKLHRNEYDWMQDDVNYADITELQQETNEEC